FHDTAPCVKFIVYFCGMIRRIGVSRTDLVKWLHFWRNSLIITYKVTKNLPLGQIFIALIFLKIRG
ncbi:hypothetical protein EEL37_11360, partial [Muribaculaceae bacterium Isolate-077 (Janvier)]